MNNAEFDRLDMNNDNRISRFEFENAATAGDSDNGVAHSAAWRTGYDRGIEEGRMAGREDYVRNQGLDLEGQRELERADSGYTPQVGIATATTSLAIAKGSGTRTATGYNNARDGR